MIRKMWILDDFAGVLKLSPDSYCAKGTPVYVLSEEKLRECFQDARDSVDWDGAGGLDYDLTFDDWLKQQLGEGE